MVRSSDGNINMMRSSDGNINMMRNLLQFTKKEVKVTRGIKV